jgi:hypothetical protein
MVIAGAQGLKFANITAIVKFASLLQLGVLTYNLDNASGRHG